MNVYDMMREKAVEMGHPIAKLPDFVWQKYMNMQDERATLRSAKLYVENYMMGNLNASEFAQVMAEDDNLRYTISDLCRLRLEPMELDIHRNDSYIDVGAGLKTFWTEIHVPIPSEIEAARDIRNINYGIEAGKGVSGASPMSEAGDENVSGKKRSFRDILNDAKKHAAEKAIEKLTPIAEGETKEQPKETEPVKLDESWFETEEGREYKADYTRNTAQQLENVIMDIEAGKNVELNPDERKKALKATGISDKDADKLVQNNESLFTDQDMAALNNVEKDVDKKQTVELRSGYSENDLNCSLNTDMQQLFDQILQHVNQDQKDEQNAEYERQAKHQQELQDQQIKRQQNKPDEQTDPLNNRPHKERKGYVSGEFEGKQASIKKVWSGHKFTDDEITKLFAGETISFDYLDWKQHTRTVIGKLEWKENDGRRYLGFTPDFDKSQRKDSGQLFTDSDEALMNYAMGDDAETTETEDKHDEETPVFYPKEEDEEITLSAADCAALFEDPPEAGMGL